MPFNADILNSTVNYFYTLYAAKSMYEGNKKKQCRIAGWVIMDKQRDRYVLNWFECEYPNQFKQSKNFNFPYLVTPLFLPLLPFFSYLIFLWERQYNLPRIWGAREVDYSLFTTCFLFVYTSLLKALWSMIFLLLISILQTRWTKNIRC